MINIPKPLSDSLAFWGMNLVIFLSKSEFRRFVINLMSVFYRGSMLILQNKVCLQLLQNATAYVKKWLEARSSSGCTNGDNLFQVGVGS